MSDSSRGCTYITLEADKFDLQAMFKKVRELGFILHGSCPIQYFSRYFIVDQRGGTIPAAQLKTPKYGHWYSVQKLFVVKPFY